MMWSNLWALLCVLAVVVENVQCISDDTQELSHESKHEQKAERLMGNIAFSIGRGSKSKQIYELVRNVLEGFVEEEEDDGDNAKVPPTLRRKRHLTADECGNTGQPCCTVADIFVSEEGFFCNNERACNVETQKCEDCGGLGLLACVGDGIAACHSEFLAVSLMTARCESCGLDGETCCDNPQNPCRDSTVRICVNSTNMCQACGVTGARCCNGLDGAGSCQDPADTCVLRESNNSVCEKTSLVASLGSESSVASDQTVLSCPEVGQEITVMAPSVVSISRSLVGELCNIILVGPLAQIPVARSYDGQDWEQYSGAYSDMAISCDATNCSFSLPQTLREDEYYTLSSTAGYDVPTVDVVARFFESTTFGMPMTTIKNLAEEYVENGGSDALASWLAAQIDKDQTPITYHRVYLRKRMNAVFLGTSSMCDVTHPCDLGSSFRRYAFTARDWLRMITIQTGPGTTRRLSINGEFVTLVKGPIETSRGALYPDGTFQICYRLQHWIGGTVRFDHPTLGCQDVKFAGVYGNPPVDVDETDTSIKLITLDAVATPIDQSLYLGNTVQMIQINSSSLDNPICSTFTNGPGLLPTVLGKFNSTYFIHTPRFKLLENTLESPIADGGYSIMAATWGTTNPDYRVSCSNPVRTFHNEDSCTMRREGNVCSTTTTRHGNLVCGSFNEVANDLTLGGTHSNGVARGGGPGAFAVPVSYDFQNTDWESPKKHIWTAVVLGAQDQLRQRMAWALSQIIAINGAGVGRESTEEHLFFYDIFVRHAFGNYRDILREVSYSPMMAIFLSYMGSKSTAFHLSEGNPHMHPDENYAREVMQLFSVGLYMLNDDGTHIMDVNGEPVFTYTNDEIMAYSRAWTGFSYQPRRGNVEIKTDNRLDFMQIVGQWRDSLPKPGLQGKYIGDGYPLCADLPFRHHLKEGARYRLLGTTSYPELQKEQEDPRWATEPNTTAERFRAVPNGPLFAALCNSSGGENGCNYKTTVTLPYDLNCTANTTECNVDTIRTVEVGETGVFYEYIRQPCIHLGFYKNPKKIKMRTSFSGRSYMCADPRTEEAGCVCCDSNNRALLTMNYRAERVRFATVVNRCAAKTGLKVCANNTAVPQCAAGLRCAMNPYYWTNQQCNLKVKIRKDHHAAIVHDVPSENGITPVALLVAVNTSTFFSVKWNDLNALDSLLTDCGPQGSPCSKQDGYCLCDVSVSDDMAFHEVPTKEEVLSLPIGAFKLHPDSGLFYSSSDVWVFGSSPYSIDTVFGAYDHAGKMQYRKNMLSRVSLPSTTLSFQNPVHMVSLANPNARDAMYETEATLDHYFYHKNMAPFLAVRLAQRFVTSNPTPRYIASISNAFRTGSVELGSQRFGSGVYGDLAATAAAVLLDPEAINTVLEADKFHGKFQEPLLKLVSTMRSLSFSPSATAPFVKFKDLEEMIGQMVFEAPSVFSFFQPDFAPDGLINASSLVAPETSVYDAPEIINIVNGYQSLAKYGLVDCYNSFGFTLEGTSVQCSSNIPGTYTASSGRFTYVPDSALGPAGVIDALATSLTSGRLSTSSRSLIQGAYVAELNVTESHERAVIRAEQLIFTTPEFHTTGRVISAGAPHPSPPTTQPASNTYKAVVFLLLDGGCDSYNMIVPHNCPAPNNTLVQDYNDERGDLAFTPLERNKIIHVAGQPCDQFAVHPELHTIEELYNDGDLAFFFNTGVLHAPTNKLNFKEITETPLFSHRDQKLDVMKGDPFGKKIGSGYLGRLADGLSRKGYKPDAISIDASSIVLRGFTLSTKNPTVVNKDGVKAFHPRPIAEPEMKTEVQILNGMSDHSSNSNIFGKTWAAKFSRALDEVNSLGALLTNITLTTVPPPELLAKRFEMITKLMLTRFARGVDRDVFYASQEGYDTHGDMKLRLADRFQELDSSLDWFQRELKQQGLWDNVTVVVVSDFGRSLTPNSGSGSDHGWGGHYWVAGGGVKGGQALGKYPDDISEDGPLNIGRGRFIPECSWESVWQAVSSWMFDGNMSENDRDDILPNALNTGSILYDMADLYD